MPFSKKKMDQKIMRLKAQPLHHPFHIVLVEPEIPPNTGNVARLCAATGSILHLVGRLGFRTDEHSVRRAGVDYWHLVTIKQHADFDHFYEFYRQNVEVCNPLSEDNKQADELSNRFHLYTARAEKSYLQAEIKPGDAFIFGRESTGLSSALAERYPDRLVGIPSLGAVRSLNLANAVSIALYEGLRQIDAFASGRLHME